MKIRYLKTYIQCTSMRSCSSKFFILHKNVWFDRKNLLPIYVNIVFRSSLYSVLVHGSPHKIITAHILCPEEEQGRAQAGLGIKVGTSPGEIRGCVISNMDEHLHGNGLQIGDR